jgi:hypothetical protein
MCESSIEMIFWKGIHGHYRSCVRQAECQWEAETDAHCGEDDTQPHASKCGDAHPNLGLGSELGDAF